MSGAQGSGSEISGHALWEARKRIGASRGLVGRMIGLHDKTVGAIERKNLPVPDVARSKAALLLELCEGAAANPTWNPKAAQPKIELPFRRPKCPSCTIPLTLRSAKHASPQRGQYFYFQCKGCAQRFWSNDGTVRPAKEGRGNWKDVKGRLTCPKCDQVCWFDGRASATHKKSIWACPRCKERYVNVGGKPESIVLPKHRKMVAFLPNRKCPKCSGERLQIRASPPNAPYWYFTCPDCGVGYRWNKKLKRLVIAKGPSKKRRVGRARGMTKARIAEAQKLLKLQAQHAQRSGSRGALKKAVADVFPQGDPSANYVRANRTLYDYRQIKRPRKQSH